ncbi:MAG: hypothetical protein R3C15_19265 [Thermoleophilia bacterium]
MSSRPSGVGPRLEKEAITPAAAVSTSAGSAPTSSAQPVGSAWTAASSAGPRSVEATKTGRPVWRKAAASPGAAWTTTSASAPSAAALRALRASPQPPGAASTMPSTRAACGAEQSAGSVPGGATTSTPAITSRSNAPSETASSPIRRRSGRGPPGAATWPATPTVRSLVAAATVIARAAEPGEETDPLPLASNSFPAATTGTTPRAAALSSAIATRSRPGPTSGSPIDRLITSIPSATAASIAARISGEFPSRPTPESVGTVSAR